MNLNFINKNTFTIIVILLNLLFQSATPCKQLKTKFGSVCVCTADFCDYLEDPKPVSENEIVIVSSTKDGGTFVQTTGAFDPRGKGGESKEIKSKQMDGIPLDDISIIVEPHDDLSFYKMSYKDNNKTKSFQFFKATQRSSTSIHIDRRRTYQKIVGFGGAYTGTVVHLVEQMPDTLKDHIFRSYYHRDGIAFNMLRTSIGGSDFDLEPWAYNEKPENDMDLMNFTKLDARDELKVKQMERLKEVSEVNKLKIMGTAWSPPKWMKSNGDWSGFSFLLPQFYQTWADYHLRFLELMDAKNMPIWSISTGNEPLNGVIGWFFIHFMSLGWTPSNQAIWLSEHLGPTIRRSKFKNVLIFGNDDQRYTYPAWFLKMNKSRSSALDYLDGLAVHWYWDDVFAPNLIDEAHRLMPEKLILNTESCIGDKPWQTHGPELGSWQRGEQYMRTILKNFKHSYNGWIDWNLVLDETGGPNYVQNNVDAPVVVNTKNFSEFYKQPIFYAIGHFSKFIPEGSIRIDTRIASNNVNVDVVAFKRPDNLIVLVLYNNGDLPLDIVLSDSHQGNFHIQLPNHSWHTILYN